MLEKPLFHGCYHFRRSVIKKGGVNGPKISIGKHKVFSMRLVKNTAISMVLRDDTVPDYQQTKQEDSKDETSCSGSDVVVTSISN